MFRLPQSSDDFIIVGMGGAGTAAFIQLVRQLQQNSLPGIHQQITITLLERTHLAGSGYAYDPQVHAPTLKVNDANPGMVLMNDDRDDFVTWVKDNHLRLKELFPHSAAIVDNTVAGLDRYAPRQIYGFYCQERLREYINLARSLGMKVVLEKNVNIVDAKLDAEKNWRLKSSSGKQYTAKNLLITTGHLPPNAYPQLVGTPNYFDTPYQNLKSIANQPVIVLGTGLSAIDTAKLLAAQQHNGSITMVSPSGQLPRIKGPATSKRHEMKFLTKENLDKKNISLKEVLDLFLQELRFAVGDQSITLEMMEAAMRYENKNPKDSFKNEISLIEAGKLRGWQLMIGELWYVPVPLIWQNLATADRPDFLKNYFSFLMKWAAGMTLSNAKEVEVLFDANQLSVVSSHEPVVYNPLTKQYSVTTTDGQIVHAPVVINATGMGYDIRHNPLLASMQRSGLIRQADYIGGVDITSDFRLLNGKREAHENAWSIGVVTAGCNLSANSIEIAAMDAEKVVPVIMHKIIQSKLPHKKIASKL